MRGALSLFRPVNTPQPLQLAVAEALHADGDAVHPRALILHKAVCFDGARVGFHGDFRVARQIQARTHAVEQGLHRRA